MNIMNVPFMEILKYK